MLWTYISTKKERDLQNLIQLLVISLSGIHIEMGVFSYHLPGVKKGKKDSPTHQKPTISNAGGGKLAQTQKTPAKGEGRREGMNTKLFRKGFKLPL